jgi:peroxiredoxin
MSAPSDAASPICVGATAPTFVAADELGEERNVPEAACPHLLIFYRGDWCPWCNGQLAALARRFDGAAALPRAITFGISVDGSERGLLLRKKLLLPFALLSDPDGSIIRCFGFWNPKERISRPAVVVIDSHGTVRYVHAGDDHTDRPSEDAVLLALGGAE